MSQDALLRLRDLTVEFETPAGTVTALTNLDLEINHGEIMGVVGESGAGKSVTGRSVMRLLQNPGHIASGTISLDGEDLMTKTEAELEAIRGSKVAMIFQDPMTSLNPVFTVGSQIVEAIELHQDVARDEARDQAIDLFEKVGIPDAEARIDDYPHEFSGGMRQRAIIAMALSCEPDLLIADEPTTALDVTIEAQILDLLQELSQEFGTSIMFITHDLGVVARICDRVSVMYAGDTVETADVNDIFKNPSHPYTQGLLASIPLIGDARNERLTTIPGSMPDLENTPSGCRFHPRCPHAVEECKKGYPEMEPIAAGREHSARCIRTDEISREWDSGASEKFDRTRDRSSDLVLEVEGLKKWFDADDGIIDRLSFDRRIGFSLSTNHVKAVNDVDFEIREGETIGLVGESGCGKSTTARTLLRLLEPDEGDIVFRTDEGERINVPDLDQTALRSVRREMQMIFQDPQSSLNPRKTVGEIIGRPMKLHDIASGDERDARIEELLELVDLDPQHRERYPHEFSGGQQQRIGIARALAVNPKCIIADEPVSALDVSVQAKIINLLMELQEEMGLSILIIAHDLRVVRHIADRIYVMYLGQIMESGTVDEVFDPPHHPYTAALLSSIPVADPQANPDRINLEGDVPTPLNPPTGCPFHTRCPEYVPGECDTEPIPTQTLSEEHVIACIHDENQLPAMNFINVHQDAQHRPNQIFDDDSGHCH